MTNRDERKIELPTALEGILKENEAVADKSESTSNERLVECIIKALEDFKEAEKAGNTGAAESLEEPEEESFIPAAVNVNDSDSRDGEGESGHHHHHHHHHHSHDNDKFFAKLKHKIRVQYKNRRYLRHHESRKAKNERLIRVLITILGVVAFLLIAAIVSFAILWNNSKELDRSKMFEEKPLSAVVAEANVQIEEKKEVEAYDLMFEGQKYRLRQDVVSVLFMGIDDEENKETEEGKLALRGTNQADTLLLGVFDTKNGTVRVIHVPRDTMADVQVLDLNGRYARTERDPICLQHGYGDGGELSCRLQTEAVQKLLFGIPIDRYVSLGLNGVVGAVNTVGGVTLTPVETVAGATKKGVETTLNGIQARRYIQSRMNVKADGSDDNRMDRQVNFLKAYLRTVRAQFKTKPGTLLNIYDAVEPYMQTDLTLDEFLFLANHGLNSDFNADSKTLYRLPVTLGANEERVYYEIDTVEAKRMVVSLFYEPIAETEPEAE